MSLLVTSNFVLLYAGNKLFFFWGLANKKSAEEKQIA